MINKICFSLTLLLILTVRFLPLFECWATECSDFPWHIQLYRFPTCRQICFWFISLLRCSLGRSKLKLQQCRKNLYIQFSFNKACLRSFSEDCQNAPTSFEDQWAIIFTPGRVLYLNMGVLAALYRYGWYIIVISSGVEKPEEEAEKMEASPVKPRKLISLQYNTSDSENEETREERKARIVSFLFVFLLNNTECI